MKWSLIPLVLILPACDPTPPPQPETGSHPGAVFERQIQAIDKARMVEGQVMNAAEAQRGQIDDAVQ